MSANDKNLRWGSRLLAMAALAMGTASLAFLLQHPDPATHAGRLFWAGALANLSLSLVLVLIALGPIRRGEKWGLAAFALPLVIYGLPMLALDATYVPRAHLATTLAPHVFGWLTALAGLGLALRGAHRRPEPEKAKAS